MWVWASGLTLCLRGLRTPGGCWRFLPFRWSASASVVGTCPGEAPLRAAAGCPFSALDVNTEERIITGLREGLEGLGGATTLLTAHRPSTVALADRVLLMVDGAVVAEGTHAELMDSSEQYRQLMTMEEG